MARMPSAAGFQLRQNFLRIAKREIMEHHHMLLLVKQGFRRFAHNQGRRQKLLLLQSEMGMHPMGAGARVHKIIVKGLAGFQWRLRQHGNAVLGGRRVQSVPVQKCFNIQIVFDPHLEPFPSISESPFPPLPFTMPKTFAARPLTSIIREATLSSRRRLRPGKACPERRGAKYPEKPPVLITSCSSQLTERLPQKGINTKEDNELTF